MRFAVIDVGSNSVRLMLSDDDKTLYKKIAVTKLAQNLMKEQVLSKEAILRTASAVSFFVSEAKEQKAQTIYIFATAAVRNARNGCEFTSLVKQTTGIDVEVVSGDVEAKIGLIGALNGEDGGVIDVGGASSEIGVFKAENIIYTHSLKWGAVTLTDQCGQNKKIALSHARSIVNDYGQVPNSNFYAVGGTATSIASMLIGSKVYQPELVNGYVVSKEMIDRLVDKLYSSTIEERKRINGLMPERAEIIAGGVAIIWAIMEKLNLDSFKVSERDNLEGYLSLKRGKL